MNALIGRKLSDLTRMCQQYRVKNLTLFGSATESETSPNDLDFSVEFQKMTPAEHADSYLGLLEDLQQLFGMKIDLIEPGPIRNPYFLRSLRETQVTLYHAA